jgi:hypothetical protein
MQKITKTYFDEASDPSNIPQPKAPTPPPPAPEPKIEEDDNDDEDSNLGRRSAEIEQSAEPEQEDPPASASGVEAAGARGQSIDGDSLPGSARRGKRGSYMKDGPTVYKLVKPLLKTIKEAKAKE